MINNPIHFEWQNCEVPRDYLLLTFDENMIEDEELIILCEMKNPDFPYWQFDEECKAEFRFCKNDIYLLKEIMELPDEIICYNRLVVRGVKTLRILLKRFAYPIRYNDTCSRFARPVP